MDLNALVGSLAPEQVAALKSALDGLSDTSGRSPFRDRQLHDLTLLPTKDDPRPTFFWSAEKPRNAGNLTKTTEFPRLMWHNQTGREITVDSAKAMAEKQNEGYIITPPANAEAPDPAAVIRQQLEKLSPEDRKLVLQNAHDARLNLLKDALLGISDEEREALAAVLAPSEAKRKSA